MGFLFKGTRPKANIILSRYFKQNICKSNISSGCLVIVASSFRFIANLVLQWNIETSLMFLSDCI